MSNSIQQAVHNIMKQVGYVQKQKTVGLNYTYAGEAALIQALRPAMVEEGVIVFVHDVTDVRRIQYQSANGKEMINTSLRGVVRFLHAESGSFIDVVALGEGADIGDKSQNKAMTGMLKYALRQTFLIETGDDPDSTSSEEVAPLPKKDRVWSIDALEAVLEDSAGIASNHEEVKFILDMSILPEISTPKTVKSWFAHWKKTEGTDLVRADAANQAYIKAKKASK